MEILQTTTPLREGEDLVALDSEQFYTDFKSCLEECAARVFTVTTENSIPSAGQQQTI